MPTDTPARPPGLIVSLKFNPSPKTRFRQHADNLKHHRAMMEEVAFDRAMDFGLLQYITQAASRVQDANGALALGYKILGVQEFLSTVKLLSEDMPVPPPQPTGNLEHRA